MSDWPRLFTDEELVDAQWQLYYAKETSGVSLAVLARLVGVSTSAMSGYASMSRPLPNQKTAYKIARVASIVLGAVDAGYLPLPDATPKAKRTEATIAALRKRRKEELEEIARERDGKTDTP